MPQDTENPDPTDVLDSEDGEDPGIVLLGHHVPPGANRILVKNEAGTNSWKKVAEVDPGKDSLVLTKMGQPQFMYREMGVHISGPVRGPQPREAVDQACVDASVVENDSIRKITEVSPNSVDLLHEIMSGMAEEQAALRAERMMLQKKGIPYGNTSFRRIDGLKTLANTWIKRKEQLLTQQVDLESPAFAAILKFLTETVAEALEEAHVRPEQSQDFFFRLSKKLTTEWKKELKNRMKNAEEDGE